MFRKLYEVRHSETPPGKDDDDDDDDGDAAHANHVVAAVSVSHQQSHSAFDSSPRTMAGPRLFLLLMMPAALLSFWWLRVPKPLVARRPSEICMEGNGAVENSSRYGAWWGLLK